MANVSAWRFGLPRAHNEFAIASITLGGVAAVAVMVALVSDGMSGWSVSDPSARQMAVELATRFAWLAAPCAMLATILGALGRRFRFAAPRSRGAA